MQHQEHRGHEAAAVALGSIAARVRGGGAWPPPLWHSCFIVLSPPNGRWRHPSPWAASVTVTCAGAAEPARARPAAPASLARHETSC